MASPAFRNASAPGVRPLHLPASAGILPYPFLHVKSGLSFPSSFSFRPRPGVASLLVVCLAASSSALAAGRSGAGAAGSGGRGNSPVISQPVVPRLTSPLGGQFTDSDVSQLDFQSRLNQLSNASERSYDIVPPTPPTPISHSPLPGYQVIRLGRAHNNRLLLAGTIAGTKGLMMLDTGANNTALGDATYHSLLLNASYNLPDGVPRAVSLNGTRTPLAEAPDFYVGQSNLGAVPVSLIPRRYLSDAGPAGSQGRLFDGLLGENILRHYHAMIDCARLVLYLDIDPARKLNLASSFARHGWTRVPMSDSGSDFTVPCTLNGHRYRLIVDTGSPFTNLDRTLLTAAGVDSHDLPYRTGLIGTDAVPVGLVDLDQLHIGSYTANGVHMIATPQSLAAFGRHDAPVRRSHRRPARRGPPRQERCDHRHRQQGALPQTYRRRCPEGFHLQRSQAEDRRAATAQINAPASVIPARVRRARATLCTAFVQTFLLKLRPRFIFPRPFGADLAYPLSRSPP